MIKHICPECGELSVRRVDPFPRAGWALMVPADRLVWMHSDGEPLCPVIGEDTAGGSSYVPALPVKRLA